MTVEQFDGTDKEKVRSPQSGNRLEPDSKQQITTETLRHGDRKKFKKKINNKINSNSRISPELTQRNPEELLRTSKHLLVAVDPVHQVHPCTFSIAVGGANLELINRVDFP